MVSLFLRIPLMIVGIALCAGCQPVERAVTQAAIATGAVEGTEGVNVARRTDDPTIRTELKALRAHPQVAAALSALSDQEERNLPRHIALTEIPAPPFGEDKRAEAFLDLLRAAGVEQATRDAEGNVLALRPGTVGARTIVLAAHIDTVFPEGTDVTVTQKGDTYSAPGIGDDTRGLIVLLSLAELLNEHGIETRDNILFVGTVGEEGLGDLRGVKALFANPDLSIDSFIAVDSGNVNWVINSAVGSHRYRVTFKGPGGHSFGGFGVAHPHQALGNAITQFTERGTAVVVEAERATFSVGRIGGGKAINAIPSESWMEVDMRSLVQDDLDKLDDALRSAVQDAVEAENTRRRSGKKLTVSIDQVGQRPAAKGDPDLLLTRQAVAVLEGMGAVPLLVPASTDANVAISLGVPAITIGNGGVTRQAHALDESWESKTASKGLELALLLTLMQSGLNADE